MKKKAKQQRPSERPAPESESAEQINDAGMDAYRRMLEEQVRYMREKYPNVRLVADMTEEEERERQRSQRELLEKAAKLLDVILAPAHSAEGFGPKIQT